MTVRAIVVARRMDEAIVVEELEEQAVRVVAVRRSRPIAAVVTDKVEGSTVAAAKTRSRIPSCGR